MAKVRVLVVDDSGFFRRRIKELLTADTDIEVIGEAADGREAVRQAIALRPDVITMDIEMPVLDGSPQIPGKETDGAVSGQDEVDDLLSSLGF